jgi:hypothetical protein
LPCWGSVFSAWVGSGRVARSRLEQSQSNAPALRGRWRCRGAAPSLDTASRTGRHVSHAAAGLSAKLPVHASPSVFLRAQGAGFREEVVANRIRVRQFSLHWRERPCRLWTVFHLEYRSFRHLNPIGLSFASSTSCDRRPLQLQSPSS